MLRWLRFPHDGNSHKDSVQYMVCGTGNVASFPISCAVRVIISLGTNSDFNVQM
jgi:hypothetical protein